MQLSFIQVILPHRSNDIETSSSHTPCNLPGNGKSVARQVGKLYFNYIIVTGQNKLQTQSITSSDTPSNGLKHCKTLHQIGITRCPSVSAPPSLNSWLGLSLHFVLCDMYVVCQQSHYVGTVYCTIATLPHFTVLRMRES